LGTRKKKKIPFLPTPPKRKQLDPSSVHAEPSNWLAETLISKAVCHHFWPGHKLDVAAELKLDGL
jgi:hypothetical protein